MWGYRNGNKTLLGFYEKARRVDSFLKLYFRKLEWG